MICLILSMKVHLTPQTPHTLSMFLSSHQSSSCLCQSVRRARWMEPSKPQLSTGIRPLHFVCGVQGEVYSYGIQIVIFILRKQILELYGKKYLKLRKIKCDFVESIPWICSPSPDATSTSVKPSRGKSRIFRLQDLVSIIALSFLPINRLELALDRLRVFQPIFLDDNDVMKEEL